MTAFLFGQWNEAAKAYAHAEPGQFAEDAKEGLPVSLVTGKVDIWPTVMAVHELAKAFANAQVLSRI